MKCVIFGVDNCSLVIILPVLIKAFNTDSLLLNEIETVPVPIDDLNEAVISYSTAMISKPYMAINNDYYIQLHIQELHMCKHRNNEYFCKNLFLIKHESIHSCEHAIFFELPKSAIEYNYIFKYEFNTTVTPSIQGGGLNCFSKHC